MQQHRSITLEDFVSQFNDESIRHDQIAQGLNVLKILQLHPRFTVLAKDGVGDSG